MEEKDMIDHVQTAAEDGQLTIHMYQQWQRRNGGPPVLDLLETYGSWANVLRLAGFENHMPRYTKAEMLRSLRKAAKELGSLSSVDYRKWAANENGPTLTEIVIQFGSWKVALVEADLLGMVAKDQKYEIIQSLLDASETLEPFNSTTYAKWARTHQRPSITKVVRRFGSWTQALEEIGLSTRKRFSEQEIMDALKEAENEVEVLTPWGYETWQKKDGRKPALKEIQHMFGSFDMALLALRRDSFLE